MAKYIDGFLLVVPKKNLDEYKKMARLGAKMWKKFGALDYKECMGEDLNPKSQKDMKHQVFTKLTKAKPNETVWFSYIVYKSKKHRDSVNAKVMQEMEKTMAEYKNKPMPFDMKRFTYGGFEVMVDI